jgi:DNA-binding NtrC family response regulator
MSETISAITGKAGGSPVHPALYVGLAGDEPRSPPARLSLSGVDRVELGRADARRFTRTSTDGVDTLAIALADQRMSSRHARITRVGTTWVLEDVGSKNGTWCAGERVARRTLADGDAFVLGHTAVVFRTAGGDAPDADDVPAAPPGLATLSPALAAHLDEVGRAARSGVPIEITGETGTGKELVARAVHARSGRTGAFVAVNCGALPATLIEGELFGFRKGAFTGASGDRDGFVRSADGGTLLLDEVAELPAASQAVLLRVLQEGEVVPLGADRAVKVDLRLVTATHRQLDAEVDTGRFRADLRARLLGVTVALPALRERREDLGMLTSALLDRLAPRRDVAFTADAVAALYAYAWPLNIRELERALEAALAVATDRIELRHLPAPLREPARAPADKDALLRERLAASLARHNGNLAAVARELGKDRTQIRRWMKRLGVRSD